MEAIKGLCYGDWTILEPRGSKKHKRMVFCECVCGKRSVVAFSSLKSGNSSSCGCSKHGKSTHPLYSVWSSMKQRCYYKEHENYARYGGRGIGICDEWRDDFKSFYEWSVNNGWKKGLQIDRANNDGGYEPGNCRFVAPSVNAKNRRNSRIWAVNGVQYETSRDAAAAINVSQREILRRCNGYTRNGKYTPPVEGYSSRPVYA